MGQTYCQSENIYKDVFHLAHQSEMIYRKRAKKCDIYLKEVYNTDHVARLNFVNCYLRG